MPVKADLLDLLLWGIRLDYAFEDLFLPCSDIDEGVKPLVGSWGESDPIVDFAIETLELDVEATLRFGFLVCT